jgi:hypothetical protein
MPGDIAVPSRYCNKDIVLLLSVSCNAAHQVADFAGSVAVCRARSRCSSEDIRELAGLYGPVLDRVAGSAAAQHYRQQQQQALPLELIAAWVPVLIDLTLLVKAEDKAGLFMVAGSLLQTARRLATAGAYGPEGVAALDASNWQLCQPVLQVLLPGYLESVAEQQGVEGA